MSAIYIWQTCAFFYLLNKRKRSFRQLFYFDRYKRFVRRQQIHSHSLTHLNAYSHARLSLFTCRSEICHGGTIKKKATFLALFLFDRGNQSNRIVMKILSPVHVFFFYLYALYTLRNVIKTYKNLYVPDMKSPRYARCQLIISLFFFFSTLMYNDIILVMNLNVSSKVGVNLWVSE